MKILFQSNSSRYLCNNCLFQRKRAVKAEAMSVFLHYNSCLLAHMLWPVSVSWTQQFIMNRVNKTLVFMFPRIIMKCHLLNIPLKELEFYFLNSYSVVMWKTNQELVTTIFYMFEYSMHLLMDITSILLLNPYDQDHDLVMRNLLFTSSNLLWSLSWKIPLLVAVVGSFSFNKSHFIR